MPVRLVMLVLVYVSIPLHLAKAYIDPGSGSLLLSMIIGFLVTASLYFKNLWYRLKSFFKFKRKVKGGD